VINKVDYLSDAASPRALTKQAYCDIEIESKEGVEVEMSGFEKQGTS
jgi:hypothetical protein